VVLPDDPRIATELLEHLADEEQKERGRGSLERRLSRSRLGRFKPMADYDWGWPRKIDCEAVESALRLDFLERARNVVIVAPQGLGKTEHHAQRVQIARGPGAVVRALHPRVLAEEGPRLGGAVVVRPLRKPWGRAWTTWCSATC
jgi:hypothetical protein